MAFFSYFVDFLVPNQELVRQEFLEALKEAKQQKEEIIDEEMVVEEEKKEEIIEEKKEEKKTLFGSYDEEKINQLVASYDWEKEIFDFGI